MKFKFMMKPMKMKWISLAIKFINNTLIEMNPTVKEKLTNSISYQPKEKISNKEIKMEKMDKIPKIHKKLRNSNHPFDNIIIRNLKPYTIKKNGNYFE